MKEFAKIAWGIFLAALTFGIWTFPMLAVLIAVNFYLMKKHPKWF